MKWQQLKRDYEERTGEPWPGFGETERRRVAAERALEEGEDPEPRGVRPIFEPYRGKRRRFKYGPRFGEAWKVKARNFD